MSYFSIIPIADFLLRFDPVTIRSIGKIYLTSVLQYKRGFYQYLNI